MQDDVGKTSGRKSCIYSTLLLIQILMVIPAGDKGILANPVALKLNKIEVMRKESTGIYDMKRRITEVRFDDQFEPLKFGILI